MIHLRTFPYTLDWKRIDKSNRADRTKIWGAVVAGRLVAKVYRKPARKDKPAIYHYEVGGKLLHFTNSFLAADTLLEEVFVAAEKDLRRWLKQKRRSRALGPRPRSEMRP